MFHLLQKLKLGTLLIFCCILAVLFTALAFPRFDRAHWYRQIVLTVITPPRNIITGLRNFTGGLWNHYVALVNAAKENDLLRARLEEANQRLIGLSVVEDENVRLRGMIEMAESLKLSGVGADVIASDPRAEFKTVTINKGYDKGIRKNLAAISYGGLVGRVAQVSSSESTVLLISDPNSSVDVFVKRSGARAVLVGRASGIGLEYLRRTSDIADGDIVVTSGLDRLAPPNIPVGTVAGLKANSSGVFKEAEVVPFVELDQLRELLVVK